ncbi:MAG: hypothetical protein M1837_003269, partial [Sclerophora amabilis]
TTISRLVFTQDFSNRPFANQRTPTNTITTTGPAFATHRRLHEPPYRRFWSPLSPTQFWSSRQAKVLMSSKRKVDVQGSRGEGFKGDGSELGDGMDSNRRATAAQLASRKIRSAKGLRRGPSPSPGSGFTANSGQPNSQGPFQTVNSSTLNSQGPPSPTKSDQPSSGFLFGQPPSGASQTGGLFSSSSNQNQHAQKPSSQGTSNSPFSFGSGLSSAPSNNQSSGFSFSAPNASLNNPFSNSNDVKSTNAFGNSGFTGSLFKVPSSDVTSAQPTGSLFTSDSTLGQHKPSETPSNQTGNIFGQLAGQAKSGQSTGNLFNTPPATQNPQSKPSLVFNTSLNKQTSEAPQSQPSTNPFSQLLASQPQQNRNLFTSPSTTDVNNEDQDTSMLSASPDTSPQTTRSAASPPVSQSPSGSPSKAPSANPFQTPSYLSSNAMAKSASSEDHQNSSKEPQAGSNVLSAEPPISSTSQPPGSTPSNTNAASPTKPKSNPFSALKMPEKAGNKTAAENAQRAPLQNTPQSGKEGSNASLLANFTDAQKQQYAKARALLSLNASFKRQVANSRKTTDIGALAQFYVDKYAEVSGGAVIGSKRRAVDSNESDTAAKKSRTGPGPSIPNVQNTNASVNGQASASSTYAPQPTLNNGSMDGKRKFDDEFAEDDANGKPNTTKKAKSDGKVTYPDLNGMGPSGGQSHTSNIFKGILEKAGKEDSSSPSKTSTPNMGTSSIAPGYNTSAAPASLFSESAASNVFAPKSNTTSTTTSSNDSLLPKPAASTSSFPTTAENSLFTPKASTSGAASVASVNAQAAPSSSFPSTAGNSLFAPKAPEITFTGGHTLKPQNTASTGFNPTFLSGGDAGNATPSATAQKLNRSGLFNNTSSSNTGLSSSVFTAQPLATADAKSSATNATPSATPQAPPTGDAKPFGFSAFNAKSSEAPKLFGSLGSGGFMESIRKAAEDNARQEKERRKAEEFDSEEDDEEEWERRDAENEAAKKKKFEEQTKGGRTQFVPGKGFIYVRDEVSESADNGAPAASTSSSGAPTATSSTTDKAPVPSSAPSPTPPVSGGASVFDSPAINGQQKSFTNNIFGHLSDADTGADKANTGDKDDESSDADDLSEDAQDKTSQQNGIEQGENDKPTSMPATREDSGSDEDFTKEVQRRRDAKAMSEKEKAAPQDSQASTSTFGGSLFDRISRPDGDSRPLPKEADKSEPTLNTPAKPSGGGAFTPLNGANSFANSFNVNSGGSNIFGAKTSPSNDNTWKPDTPIKFGAGSSSSTSFNVHPPENAPSGEQPNTSAKPIANLFGGGSSVKTSPLASTNSPKGADVGFSFGAPPKTGGSSLFVPSTAATSNATSRATSPGATTDTGAESHDSGTEAEKANLETFSKVGPGEENEDIVYECRAKAMKYDPKEKKNLQMGVGCMRILKHRESAKVRVLMRQDPSGKVTLNTAVMKGITYSVKGKALINIPVPTEAGKLEAWLLQVKDAKVASEAVEALQEQQKTQA